MTATVVVALFAAPGIGYLAERFGDPRAVAQALAQEADDAARDRMLDLGWQPLAEQGSPAAAALARDRGVEVLAATRAFRLDLANGAVTGTAPAAADATRAASVVAAELARYPRAFLQAARLRRVLVCQGLREGAITIPSLPNYERTLLLDASSASARLRRLLHHEVFHFADYAEDNQVQRDPAWAALNDHWFVYGDGGRYMRDADASRLTDKLPGFVTRYATSALEEDKAETFSFMMVAPADIARIAAHDPVVRSKVAYVKSELGRLAPCLDAAFWRRVDAAR